MNNNLGSGDSYIYCFGGFDKKAVHHIERVKLIFDADS